MVILTQPASFSLSGNLEKFQIRANETISFILMKGTEEILSASYTPGSDQAIVIDLREIVESHLSFRFIDQQTSYVQESLVADFTAIINGTEYPFRVLRGGVDRLGTSAESFCRANFLTWQPQIKPVTYYTPEFLGYYCLEDATVYVKAYFTAEDGNVTSEVKAIATLFHGYAYTIPVQYAVICSAFDSRFPSFYDVWVQNSAANRLTYVQRYVADNILSEQEEWILFENSLGGIDTFRAYGQSDFKGKHTHNVAEIDDVSLEYRVDTERTFQKSTGFLNNYQRRWLLDFFPSKVKYVYVDNYIRSIVVTEDNTTYTDKELPTEYKFTYKYADARPYLNLSRSETLPSNLDIVLPELGSFTIPPRLVEFPTQPLSEGVLFPVQNPYSEQWGTTTIGSIFNHVLKAISVNYDGVGGFGHAHANYELLNLLSWAEGYLLVDGKKIKAGYADEVSSDSVVYNKFLRKDKDDTAQKEITFADGLKTLDAVWSYLTGKGTLIKDGLIQTDRIEVRQSMTVMDLIINELQGIAADYIFSDVGKVDTVTDMAERTYVLHIEKKTDFDFTTLGENDILKMVVNDMHKGGTNYYSSWMLVRSVDAETNEVLVSLYDDNQVQGGKNFPPMEGYNLARMGNAVVDTDNERADYWTLSSREGRIQFLRHVFSPQLDDSNYALTLGKLPDIEAIKNLPVVPNKDIGLVAQTAVIENLYQFDYNGDIIPNLVDRGNWSLSTAESESPYRYEKYERTYPDGKTKYTSLEQHTVWHMGCRWGCLYDKTTQEPRWNSPHWSLLEGNTELDMRFSSSEGNSFHAGKVDTNITPSVYLGNIDISEDILAIDWLWTYELGEYNGRVLHLTNELMPTNWSRENKAKFTCTAYIRQSEDEITPVSNIVTI